MSKDYYQTLGIEKNASADEIKKAFRRLAGKYHPDQAQGDKKAAEEKFKEISEAYETLSDPQKRQQYDQFGSGGPQFGGGGFDFGGGAQHFDFEGFGDVFESFFGGGGARGGRPRGAARGRDLETTLTVAFEEAIFGTTAELDLQRIVTCKTCAGNGAEKGSRITTCETCHGAGQIAKMQRTVFGMIQHAAVCPDCNGEGKTYEKKCSVCHGTGRTRVTERLKVRIPAGVDEGTTIKVTGQGEAGTKGGPTGDLYVHIRVTPSKELKRKGSDVLSTEKIHLVQAILGGEVNIKTVHGVVPLKIPAGTQSGTTFTIADHGAPKLGASSRGNHIVTIIVEIPKKISGKEKELYREIAREAGLEGEGKKHGWFS